MKNTENKTHQFIPLRKNDPYMDRRSGEDRRQVYSIDYFLKGNEDRRESSERRIHSERRLECIPINKWASVCPDEKEFENNDSYVLDIKIDG